MQHDNNSRRRFLGSVAALGGITMIAPLELGATGSSKATGNPVVHFEIGCKDLEKTGAFYTDIFGWTKSPMPGGSLIETNSTEGIQGHMTSLGHEPHQYITFYIQVDDINATLTKIEAAGGKKIVGPISLPDKRQFAWFSDPGGNMVALITKGE
jgi:predicted enzyme related to lactoylglutathione lyase